MTPPQLGRDDAHLIMITQQELTVKSEHVSFSRIGQEMAERQSCLKFADASI